MWEAIGKDNLPHAIACFVKREIIANYMVREKVVLRELFALFGY